MTPDQRRQQIQQRKAPVESSTDRPAVHKIWVREGWRYDPVWQVPIEALVLNVDNKRFGAERDLVETKLGRSLDPANNPDDDKSIVAILCDSSLDVDLEQGVAVGTPSKDFLALREDWLTRKQAEPIWIRPDGTVRNGNRRLAMLKRLRADGSDQNWVEAIILDPDDIDETELFRMEQREQLTENFKKRYQDVNALLALREAAEQEGIYWEDRESVEAIASRLKHYAGRDDAGYAFKQLNAIRAVDAYLTFIGVPGRYSLVTRQVEVFREAGICLSTYDEEPDEQYELMRAAFAFIQAGKTYLDLRKLRKMFGQDRDLFDQMLAEIEVRETESGWTDAESSAEVDSPDLAVVTSPESDDEDTYDDTPPTVAPHGYPKDQVGDAVDEALDTFDASLLDISAQLSQALARLRAVRLETLPEVLAGDGAGTVRARLEEIRDWVQAALAEDT